MSRTRIVKGNITKIIGGNYKIYSKDNIENNASKVIQVGKESGVTYGEPTKPPNIEFKPKKIKFRPNKIDSTINIIAVVEKIEQNLKTEDNISIAGRQIDDNWISVNGKLYFIPKNISLFGTTFFKVNDDLYQPIDVISNCISADDYIKSIDMQLQILKEFIQDIESSNLKFKDHIKDRLFKDGYSRLYDCIQYIEKLFMETDQYEEVKKWILERLKN